MWKYARVELIEGGIRRGWLVRGSSDPGMHPREGRGSCYDVCRRLASCYLLLVWSGVVGFVGGSAFEFEVTHRFSEKARSELRERHGDAFQDWPSQGTAEYYQMLLERDLQRHRGRILSASKTQLLDSATGNATYFFQNDGLQYTYIELGTPSKTFFVALDTGSDLFWVPCAHCISCAPSSSPLYAPYVNTSVTIYDPTQSTTYQPVGCNSPYCQSSCGASSGQCPYLIQYLTPASTAGLLVEDVMYLIPQKGVGPTTTANIIFGCGTNQTGGFLGGESVPDGLMGLGLSNVSVPSILAHANIIQNSFSMCFDVNGGTGRLVFGDRGPPSAASTPILTIANAPFYWVGVSKFLVGNSIAVASITAIFDTGTTYTLLSSSAYKTFVAAVDSQTQYQISNTYGPFDRCYSPPSDITSVELPTITLEFTNGAQFSTGNPFVFVVDQSNTLLAICLAVLNGGTGSTNIIGHNFMTNHSITFDRLTKKISWIQTSCDNYATYTGDESSSPAPAPAPVTASTTSPVSQSPPNSIHQLGDAGTRLLPTSISLQLLLTLLLFSFQILCPSLSQKQS